MRSILRDGGCGSAGSMQEPRAEGSTHARQQLPFQPSPEVYTHMPCTQKPHNSPLHTETHAACTIELDASCIQPTRRFTADSQ